MEKYSVEDADHDYKKLDRQYGSDKELSPEKYFEKTKEAQDIWNRHNLLSQPDVGSTPEQDEEQPEEQEKDEEDSKPSFLQDTNDKPGDRQ